MSKTRTRQAKNTSIFTVKLKARGKRHQKKNAGFQLATRKMLSYAALLIRAGVDDDLVISSSAGVDTCT